MSFWRKKVLERNQMIEIYDPKRPWYQAYLAKIVDHEGNVLARSRWTYARWAASKEVKENLRRAKAIAANEEPTVTVRSTNES